MIQQTPLLPDEEPREQHDFTHEEQKRAFEFALKDVPWADVYAAMVASGFRWREAAYVAWAVQTKPRVPKTAMELADMMGVSPKRITKYKRDPRLAVMQLKFARLAYLDALPEIVQASIDVASKPSYKSTPERNNIINKILALGTDTLNLRLSESEQDLSQMSDADLLALLGEDRDEDA